jgi:hypothetical protein
LYIALISTLPGLDIASTCHFSSLSSLGVWRPDEEAGEEGEEGEEAQLGTGERWTLICAYSIRFGHKE